MTHSEYQLSRNETDRKTDRQTDRQASLPIYAVLIMLMKDGVWSYSERSVSE
jgi:hypothetical protein